MAAQQSGTGPPPKPWERSGSSSGPAPFKPPSAGTTSDIVEASGTARPGEIVTPDANTTAANRNALGRSLPSRPWEQQQTYGNNSYMGGGYGSSSNYNSGYGSGTYGSYGGGMYGNSMYRGGMTGGAGSLYGGGMTGGAGSLYGGGMYGGGMYNSSFGGAMGGYGGVGMGMGMGMGMGGPPYGDQDPNNPFAAPSSPPGFWLFDRSGMLYGELARFVFRLLGIRTKSQKAQPPQPNGLPGPHNFPGGQNHIEGPKVAPYGTWDGVWGNE